MFHFPLRPTESVGSGTPTGSKCDHAPEKGCRGAILTRVWSWNFCIDHSVLEVLEFKIHLGVKSHKKKVEKCTIWPFVQESNETVYYLYFLFPTAISSNLGAEMTVIWLFVTVMAGFRPNANISKSIRRQCNYMVSTDKEKRNIGFSLEDVLTELWIWESYCRQSGGTEYFWEQVAGNKALFRTDQWSVSTTC